MLKQYNRLHRPVISLANFYFTICAYL